MAITVQGGSVVMKVPYVGNVHAVIWLFEGRIYCRFLWSVVKESNSALIWNFGSMCVLWVLVIELTYKKERVTNEIWFMSIKEIIIIQFKEATL